MALELVDIFPELNGSLPHPNGGRWWVERDGRLGEVDAALHAVEPGSQRSLSEMRMSVVSLRDGGSLAVTEADAGVAIVRSNGERFDVDVEDTEPVAVAHPLDTGAVLEVPMGQDCTCVVGVHVSSGAMVCRGLLSRDECTTSGFGPDGQRRSSDHIRATRPFSVCSAGRTGKSCTNSTTSTSRPSSGPAAASATRHSGAPYEGAQRERPSACRIRVT